ncbi:hypothetical protein Pogu_2053 [Pyrobaculum oguniense TE7]|uniref:Polysaccharide pyruvyl transferase domain-containing protein n=1 Tax=Pyrobaculum oguniense (strain DSM 13380 / JCM 10595 / TE7) TaxID=698757 RepID=H6QB83_PYROT|nr:hypothetical protein Pogu_2053 [Pyrobaculum oguniense TE7]
MQRLLLAEAVIKEIASAKLVVTSRLHAALPAVGLDTDVIFIPPKLDYRQIDYIHFFNVICYASNFNKCISKIQNLGTLSHKKIKEIEEVKENLMRVVKAFINT